MAAPPASVAEVLPPLLGLLRNALWPRRQGLAPLALHALLDEAGVPPYRRLDQRVEAPERIACRACRHTTWTSTWKRLHTPPGAGAGLQRAEGTRLAAAFFCRSQPQRRGGGLHEQLPYHRCLSAPDLI